MSPTRLLPSMLRILQLADTMPQLLPTTLRHLGASACTPVKAFEDIRLHLCCVVCFTEKRRGGGCENATPPLREDRQMASAWDSFSQEEIEETWQ